LENISYKNLIIRHFADQTSPEEEKVLLDWLKEDTKNQKLYREIEVILKTSKNVLETYSPDTEKKWEELNQAIAKVPDSTRIITMANTHWWKVAAGIILIVGLALFFRNQEAPNKENEPKLIASREVFAKDSVVSFYLPDSSKILLNLASKISFSDEFLNNRTVNLSGEAFFEVKHDSLRPFIILTGNALIKVLGTSFNVRAYENENKSEVDVIEGTVEFHSKNQDGTDQTTVVTKGEKIEFNKSEGSITKKKSAGKKWWHKDFGEKVNRMIKKVGKELKINKRKTTKQ